MKTLRELLQIAKETGFLKIETMVHEKGTPYESTFYTVYYDDGEFIFKTNCEIKLKKALEELFESYFEELESLENKSVNQ